jgi:acyl carrier protein
VIEEDLRGIVAEVAELESASIDPTVPFAEAGIDSLMAIEIAVDVERLYDLHFDEDELKEIVNFASLVALTRRGLAERDGASSEL